MFERKTTVKLDQDKKKFLSSNANKETADKKLNNPFEKKTFVPVNQQKKEEQPKRDPFMAPAYETKRKDNEIAKKAEDTPAQQNKIVNQAENKQLPSFPPK